MKVIVPIKDRLNEKLKTSDIMSVKQAFVMYLADNDPGVEKTAFTNELFIKMLPYLKEADEAWNSMQPEDCTTTCNAVGSAYHCVRNQLRSTKNLRELVNDHIEEQNYVEQPVEEEVVVPVVKMTTRKETAKTQKSKNSDIKSQNSQGSTKKLGFSEVQPAALAPLLIPVKSEPEIPSFESVHAMLLKCPFHAEYKEATLQLKARKRDVKAAEKKILEMQSKLIGLPNPFEDSE